MKPRLELIHTNQVLAEAVLDGKPLKLTQQERSLVKHLAQVPGKVLLRDFLMAEYDMRDFEVYHLVYRVRRKLGRQFIEQVGGRGRAGRGEGAGSGYRLVGLEVVWVETRAS